MDCVREEILDTLDSFGDIDSCVMECTLSVYETVSREFDKIISVMESNGETIDSSFGLFQEGDVIDYATGKHTADGTIKKIILFVPRLLIGIVKAIAGAFSKDKKKETDDAISKAQYTITNASSEELTQIAKQSREVSGGEINFDPKTKKFSLGEKFKHTKNRLIMLGLFPAVIVKIKRACQSNNVPYKALANDIKDIFLKNKAPDGETVAYTLDSMKELLNDSFTLSLAMKASCEEVSSLLEKQMRKDFADGKDIEKSKAAKDLVDQIGNISGVVTKVTGFSALSRKVLSLFGRPAAHSVMYSDKYDELADLKAEKKKLKSVSKEKKAQAKLERKIQKQKKGLTKLRDDAKKDVAQSDKYLNKTREVNDLEDKVYDDTGRYPKDHGV